MVESEFFEWLEIKDYSPETIRKYLIYIKALKKMGELNQKNVDKFFHKYKHQSSRGALKTYLSFLKHKKVPLKIKILKIKHKKREVPEIITKEEVRLIEKTMQYEGGKLMLLLSFYCGLRAGELLRIEYDDFNWKEWRKQPERDGILKVIGKGNKKDIVPVKQFIMERLNNWLRKEGIQNPIFPINYPKWRRGLIRYSMKALGKKVKPHTLRHSSASHLHNEDGWDINYVKNFLRHEDISTTQIYAHVSKDKIFSKYAESF